jgi:endo-cleaving rubber dioxygenase
VRHLLPKSPYWSQVTDEKIPISQRDMLVTWASLPTTVMQKMVAWKVPIAAGEADAYLHTWQVAAHMLGFMDEYIPASWDAANAQAEQVLTPVLGPTSEGVNLAQILLNLGDQVDGGVITPHLLGAFTRYLLGDQIAGWLQIPPEPVWEPLFAEFWPPFVAAREGLLEFPGTQDLYWTFDEFVRQATLLYLSEGQPISIELPTADRTF